MSFPYSDHRAWAEGVAREAGAVLLDAYGRVSAREKRPFDLVTDADLASQALFARRLAERFPDHALLAEEEGAVADPDAGWCWVVDPLDGTVNFAHNFPFWCVSVGLQHDGRPAVGVIFDPLHGRMFAAEAGGGASLDGRPLRVSAVDRLDGALIATGWPTDFAADADRQLALVRQFSDRTHSIRRTGSTALNLALVALGGVDVTYATSVNPWDVAAGVLLIREAGGTVTDLGGRPYRLGSEGILASNGRLHAEALERVAGAAGTGLAG